MKRPSPALIDRTRAFVRDVLVNVMGQETNDAQIATVADKIIKGLPESWENFSDAGS